MEKFDPTRVTGLGLDGGERAPVSLKDRFVIPPFSVLRAMDGDWVKRKAGWIAIGIQSELGRGGHEASPGGSHRPACDYSEGKRGDGHGRAMDDKAGVLFGSGQNKLNAIMAQRGGKKKPSVAKAGLVFGDITNYDGSRRFDGMCGTSIFDPVVCELAYRWFSPPNGSVLDPFAGGSVRGIVAAMLGRVYTGIDLRVEQVEANTLQWEEISKREYAAGLTPPWWVAGDSLQAGTLLEGEEFDFVFSCPPYGDLEVYSDDPNDLSTMPHEQFIEMYRAIIAQSVSMLKEDRFACFVVGDFRDKRGIYRNFVSDTISAFQDAGAALYNEAILVTAIGSLPVRVKRQFEAGRKLGKTHQNILVFYKGDPKNIKENFKEGL